MNQYSDNCGSWWFGMFSYRCICDDEDDWLEVVGGGRRRPLNY